MIFHCSNCKRETDAPLFGIFGATCSKCGSDLLLGKNNMKEENNNSSLRIFGLITISILVLLFLSGFVYTIPAGERGVILTFGKPSMNAMSEGLHFKIPIAQSVIKIDVKTQKYETGASSASKDLQIVSTNIAVNYHLLPETTPELYRDVGKGYSNRLIQPAVQEVVKASTAQFTAEELITKRPQVKEEIKNLLIERLSNRGIIVEDISITDFQFSETFNNAIEAKVTAEQQKLKADRDLERIEVEAKQKVVSAQAEAESIRIQSQALKENPDVLELRWIEKWDGIMPTTYVGGSNELMIGID